MTDIQGSQSRGLSRTLLLATAVIGLLAPMVALADGIPRTVAAVALIALPAGILAKTRRLPGARLFALALMVALAAAGIAMADVREHYGAVAHQPVGHNSDQIDFTLMGWTWAEHGVVGTTPGGPAARQVAAAAMADPPRDTRRLDRWWARAELPDQPAAYSYRAFAYPLALGTLWRATGYRPDLGPWLNIGMLSLAVGILTAALCFWWSPAAGVSAGLLLAVSSEPLWWAGQNMSETLTVLGAAALAASLLGLVRHRSIPWFLAVGASLGLLALTKQMFVFAGAAVILAVAIWAWPRRRIAGAAAAGALFGLLLAPWLAYNVGHTGTPALATGTAGWHDMPASYSAEYVAGENRVAVREQTFTMLERETGSVLDAEVPRALAGRALWWERALSGEYLPRLPDLIALKVGRTLGADPFGWLTRAAAVAAFGLILARGREVDRQACVLLAVPPVALLLFIAATVEAGSRLYVTSWVFAAAVIGVGVHVLSAPSAADGRNPAARTDRLLLSPARRGSWRLQGSGRDRRD